MLKIGVFAIILNEKEAVLLCHRRDHDLWNLPGGGLEIGESPWEGVIREVKEETGFDVEVEKCIGIYNKTEKQEIVFSFKCNIVSGELTLNDEADQIEYFKLDQIPKNTSLNQLERIHDYFLDKNHFYMKEQNSISSIDLIKQGKL